MLVGCAGPVRQVETCSSSHSSEVRTAETQQTRAVHTLYLLVGGTLLDSRACHLPSEPKMGIAIILEEGGKTGASSQKNPQDSPRTTGIMACGAAGVSKPKTILKGSVHWGQ